MHENYDNDEMTNDIALLVLSRDIRFSQLVGPVCLPNEKYDLVGKAVKVLGKTLIYRCYDRNTFT